MLWLHQDQTCQTKPCQTKPDRARPKKLLVLSGFPDQTFAGNLEEVGQVVPDSARISLCLQKETESGVVWLNLANFLLVSGVPGVKEPDSNRQKRSGSVLYDLVWYELDLV